MLGVRHRGRPACCVWGRGSQGRGRESVQECQQGACVSGLRPGRTWRGVESLGCGWRGVILTGWFPSDAWRSTHVVRVGISPKSVETADVWGFVTARGQGD